MAWFRPKQTSNLSEEAALLQKVGQGDTTACRLLLQRHLQRVTRFAHHMLNDPVEAEDVAQEVFCKLWKIADQWKPEAQVDTWLHQVTHHLCLDRLRRCQESLPGELPDIEDERPSPLENHFRDQVSQTVEKALAEIPERQRAAIVLVYYQEMAGNEAANILGVSVEALESLLTRGRKSLRLRLITQKEALLGEET